MRDDDWSEIEVLLSSPAPARRRHRTSRSLGRGLAGVTALIATGALALAGWGVLQYRCGGGCDVSTRPAETAALPPTMPSTTMAVPAPMQVASRRAALEEGRSVSAEEASPAIVRATDPPAVADGGSAEETLLRHRRWHRHKHN